MPNYPAENNKMPGVVKAVCAGLLLLSGVVASKVGKNTSPTSEQQDSETKILTEQVGNMAETLLKEVEAKGQVGFVCFEVDEQGNTSGKPTSIYRNDKGDVFIETPFTTKEGLTHENLRKLHYSLRMMIAISKKGKSSGSEKIEDLLKN